MALGCVFAFMLLLLFLAGLFLRCVCPRLF
jgi:hypothetical protein